MRCPVAQLKKLFLSTDFWTYLFNCKSKSKNRVEVIRDLRITWYSNPRSCPEDFLKKQGNLLL